MFTKSTAAVRVFVLHDYAVDDLAELLEVGLQAIVGRAVVQASDEDLTKDFAFRSGSSSFLIFRRRTLDLDLGAVQRVWAGLETSLSLLGVGVGDESKAAVRNEKLSMNFYHFKMFRA